MLGVFSHGLKVLNSTLKVPNKSNFAAWLVKLLTSHFNKTYLAIFAPSLVTWSLETRVLSLDLAIFTLSSSVVVIEIEDEWSIGVLMAAFVIQTSKLNSGFMSPNQWLEASWHG